MPVYSPLTDQDRAVAIGEGYEHATLDLKRTYLGPPPTSAFHIAKDVAAFANWLGGTILIGAQEDQRTGSVARYFGLTPEALATTQALVSNAVRDKCSPRPLINFARPLGPSGEALIAVNVDPSVAAPIGVRVRSDKSAEDWGGDDAWAFPVRTGTDSAFLLPEQLAMLMIPHVRRTLILVSAIPPGTQCTVRIFNRNDGVEGSTWKWFFQGVDEAANTIAFKLESPLNDRLHRLPLDQVQTVYEDDGKWCFSFRQYR